MKGRRRTFYLVLLFLTKDVGAAQGPAEAARELARRILNGGRGSVSLAVRGLPEASGAEVAEVRRALEGELRGRGATLVESGGTTEVRVTLSRNLAGDLLVAEIKRGEEAEVVMLPYAAARAGPAAVAVERTLITEQADAILDIAWLEKDLLMLQGARVARLGLEGGRWVVRASAPLAWRAWPRDLRGRLVVEGGSFLAYLPGAICSGALEPLEARCRDAAEAWPSLGYLAANRNYFDGRFLGKTVPPFYTVAAAQEPGGKLWIFARLDGRAWLHGSGLEPLGPLGNWGSDMAGVEAQCGNSLVLATRPGDGSTKDSIHVYRIVDRQASDAGPAVDMPGPVTAFWPAGGRAVLAVARNISSGAYGAYRLEISCDH